MPSVRPEQRLSSPGGAPHEYPYWGGPSSLRCGELDAAGLHRLLPADPKPSDESLAAQLNIDDPHIVAIMGNMLQKPRRVGPSGSLYGDSLSLELAAYVAAVTSVKSGGRRR